MFDGQGLNAPATSIADMYRGAARGIGRGLIDPYMQSKGFISQENQIMDVMKDVDISSVDSVSSAFNKIMEINPQAAAEFRTQVLPLVTAKQNELLAQAKGTTTPKDRQTKEVGYSYKGVSDPTRTMLVELVAGKWQPIIDPSTNLPYSEDKFAGDSYTGTIPAGWESVEIDGVRTLRPIKGGPADIEIQDAKKAQERAKANLARKADRVLDIGGEMRDLIDKADADFNAQLWGVVGMTQSKIPGTKSADLDELIKTIIARVGFDELQSMRDASPTGGALGQVSERELDQLNAALGSLGRMQSKEQFLRNLARIEEEYQNILDIASQTGDGSWVPRVGNGDSGSGSGSNSAGI